MTSSLQPKPKPPPRELAYPENPPVVRVWRGSAVESQHRGAWVLCDASGTALAGVGEWTKPVFARSAVKCLQALPLFESGAADRFGFSPAEIALTLASHSAEPRHVEVVTRTLARLGLSVSDLRCGPQPPSDPEARAGLRARGERPSAAHNNCSGKHTGFLALALHLGVPVERYLDPEGAVQRAVRDAVLAMTGLAPGELSTAVDGCSAPTFRLPLAALATAYARVADPSGLSPARRAACERMAAAVAAHPDLIAGTHQRICTSIARATGGRLFPKIGGEAVYAVADRGSGRAIALKIDDGSTRGLHALLVDLLRRHRFGLEHELAALEPYAERTIRNWAGLEVGRTEVVG